MPPDRPPRPGPPPLPVPREPPPADPLPPGGATYQLTWLTAGFVGGGLLLVLALILVAAGRFGR